MDWSRYLKNFEAYLKLEKGLADNSVQAYLRDASFLRSFGEAQGIGPEQFTLDHLQQLLNELNLMDIAVATQCRVISGWRTFFRMLVIDDDMAENPAEPAPSICPMCSTTTKSLVSKPLSTALSPTRTAIM